MGKKLYFQVVTYHSCQSSYEDILGFRICFFAFVFDLLKGLANVRSFCVLFAIVSKFHYRFCCPRLVHTIRKLPGTTLTYLVFVKDPALQYIADSAFISIERGYCVIRSMVSKVEGVYGDDINHNVRNNRFPYD